MAAGLGTRMRPFTTQIPKPFLPVMGVPVIQFAVDALVEAKIQSLVLNIHHLPDVARKELEKIDFGSMKITISDESALLLGSAGGLKKAEKYFEGEPFVYLNGDVMNGLNISELVKRHIEAEVEGVKLTLAVHEKSPSGEKYRRMKLSHDERKLTGFGAAPEYEVPFFTGSAVIDSSLLVRLKEEPCDFVPHILNENRVTAGEVGVLKTNSIWIDVGHPRGWLEAHFRLMSELETSSRLPDRWRTRIESTSAKVKQGVWAMKNTFIPKKVSEPAYLAIENCSANLDTVQANTVAYGEIKNLSLQPNTIYWGGFSAS